MTHDLLDDLVEDVPRQVVPDIDAGVAGRHGSAAQAATPASASPVSWSSSPYSVGAGTVTFDRPSVDPADGGAVVTGYPGTLPRPVVLTDLPGAAGTDGRGAGPRRRSTSGRSSTRDGRTLADSPTSLRGRTSGRRCPTTAGCWATCARSLTTAASTSWSTSSPAARTEFAEVGEGGPVGDEMLTDQRYFSSGQAPGFWSPDDQWLALATGAAAVDDAQPGPLLLGVDGEVRELGVGDLAGGLARLPTGSLLLDAEGRAEDRRPRRSGAGSGSTLDVPDGFEVFGQWSASLSPDGSRIAVVSDLATNEVVYGTSHQVSATTPRPGELIETVPWRASAATSCLLAWQDDTGAAPGPVRLGLIVLATGDMVVELSRTVGRAAAAAMLRCRRARGPDPARPGPDGMALLGAGSGGGSRSSRDWWSAGLAAGGSYARRRRLGWAA